MYIFLDNDIYVSSVYFKFIHIINIFKNKLTRRMVYKYDADTIKPFQVIKIYIHTVCYSLFVYHFMVHIIFLTNEWFFLLLSINLSFLRVRQFLKTGFLISYQNLSSNRTSKSVLVTLIIFFFHVVVDVNL